MKKILKRIHKLLLPLGIDILKMFYFFTNLKWYINGLLIFKKKDIDSNKFKFKLFPIFGENKLNSGSINSHYFIQDLYVSQRIFHENPSNILDIGSRIDGFVSHVASFREIDVMDIRPMNKKIKNINFKKLDLTSDVSQLNDSYNLITCLHAIEHFGLGRYGDKIDPSGHLKGIINFHKILKKDGILYLSFPIGENSVFFNAHRVFSIKYIITILEKYFKIDSLTYISDQGELFENASIFEGQKNNFNCNFGCAIFRLIK